jgi:hypothetical protein
MDRRERRYGQDSDLTKHCRLQRWRNETTCAKEFWQLLEAQKITWPTKSKKINTANNRYKQRNRYLLEFPGVMKPYQHADFSPVRRILDFKSIEL